MGPVSRSLAGLLWLSSVVVAQDLSTTPGCAEICLADSLPSSGCAGDGLGCVCVDADLMEDVTACFTESCTPKDALVAANLTSIACDAPIRDKRSVYIDGSIGFLAATSLVVALRIFERFYFGCGLYADDYLILFSYTLGIPSSIINVVGLAGNGLGKDAWTLSFDELTRFLRFLYVNEVLYFTEVFAVKLSILAFYLRIFPHATMRKLLWGTISLSTVLIIVFDLVTIFQCKPISHKWAGWNGDQPGRCLSINAVTWAIAAASIVLDFWMLALPLSQLKKLQLHWKKKVGVAMMFSVGMFVTAVSILRLQFLVYFGNSTNPTWDQFATCYWSSIELNVSVCCACMPSLRLLLVRIFPRAMGSTRDGRHSDAPVTGILRRRRGDKSGVADPGLKIIKSRGFQLDYQARANEDSSGEMELDDMSLVRK